jgi:hypothetical protein
VVLVVLVVLDTVVLAVLVVLAVETQVVLAGPVVLVVPALLALVVSVEMFYLVALAGLPTILTRIHVMGLV